MKKLTMLLSLLCLTTALVVPASALEYDIAAPGDPEYGKPTSVEPVVKMCIRDRWITVPTTPKT